MTREDIDIFFMALLMKKNKMVLDIVKKLERIR